MRILICAFLLLLLTGVTATAQSTFSIGGITAQPGTLASGTLRIPARTGDSGTEIPFSVVHGTKPGAVLALIAGTHGMEYAPIVALQRLRRAIDPTTLAGTIIMVHVANMPSFLGRTIVDHTGLAGYYDGDFEFTSEIAIPPPPPGRPNPFDGRVFPSIFSVLPQQLGLRLESGRGPVDVLVIDSIERPTEN